MARYHCINLDGMSRDELSAIVECTTLNYHAKQRAYARAKQRAMTERLRGDIMQATIHEADCERIYESLPASLRW